MSREYEPNCEIVDKARVLADIKGLDASQVFCPYIHVCNGETCCFALATFKPVKKIEHPIDKFYDKVEASIIKKEITK